jgi:hypothetical protein
MGLQPHPVKSILFRNLTPSQTGFQGGQGSPRAVVPSEEEEEEAALIYRRHKTLDLYTFSNNVIGPTWRKGQKVESRLRQTPWPSRLGVGHGADNLIP